MRNQMKQTLKRLANMCGYEIHRKNPTKASLYSLHRYLSPDGTFDYESYRSVQTAGNRQKIDTVWVLEENIKYLSDYIRNTLGDVNFGLCHGTRRGMEQQWFSKYLQCSVLGTELSDTATEFPNTIQWDFHDAKQEWLDSIDFIYSNSFDHSYDPEACLNTWASCLKPGGVCIIEHTSKDEKSTELDPFGASLSAMPYLVLLWAKGRFFVRELLTAPAKRNNLQYIAFLVIQRL